MYHVDSFEVEPPLPVALGSLKPGRFLGFEDPWIEITFIIEKKTI